MASLASQPHPPLPIDEIPPWPVVRFTVDEYHRLIELGILTEDDNLELLDGWLVRKMPENPPHDGTIMLLQRLLFALLPSHWTVRIQSAIETQDSEPEPDLAIVQNTPETYLTHHPRGNDISLVIEVADSSVDRDRKKSRLYARAGIPVYWIVNLEDRVLEMYADPQGSETSRDYAIRRKIGINGSVELTIAGQVCGVVAVADMIKV